MIREVRVRAALDEASEHCRLSGRFRRVNAGLRARFAMLRTWQAELRRAVKKQLRVPSPVLAEGRSLCTVIRIGKFRGGALVMIGLARSSASAE